MLTERQWEEIRYSLVEGGFFDFEARPKTVKAVRQVIERMSPEEIDTLEERVSTIFAPALGKDGEVYPWTNIIRMNPPEELPAGVEYEPPSLSVMVYLAPRLEQRSQKYIESVIAHEFAHVLLHPPGKTVYGSMEWEADMKAKSWGFKPAYREHLKGTD